MNLPACERNCQSLFIDRSFLARLATCKRPISFLALTSTSRTETPGILTVVVRVRCEWSKGRKLATLATRAVSADWFRSSKVVLCGTTVFPDADISLENHRTPSEGDIDLKGDMINFTFLLVSLKTTGNIYQAFVDMFLLLDSTLYPFCCYLFNVNTLDQHDILRL